MRLGILTTHPIQYQAPWFRALAQQVDLQVFFACQPDARVQGTGFGLPFTWDIDLLSGYPHEFLNNAARNPDLISYNGCDTPEIAVIIARGGFDAFIVCGWQHHCYWQAIRACRRAGVPVLVRGDSQLHTPRSRWKKLAKEVAYRLMLRQFDGFLCVGRRNREYLAHYGVLDERIFPAPHFIDNAWFALRAQTSRREWTRAAWGCETGDVIALFVGKFIPKKRPADLIDAVAMLPQTERPVIVMVGAGELMETVRQQAEKMGIHVVFAGFKNQSELPACYSAADVLVLPSDGGETWGLVVNEAMACGTPAIVSDACGCSPDLIDEGTSGFAFPTGDIAALAKCLQQVTTITRRGHDWQPALKDKLADYSVEACTRGTLEAIKAVSK